MKRLLTLMLTAALSLPVWALDEAGQARLHAVQTRWAEIQYQLPEAQREAALEKLAAESAAFTREQPQAAEAWVWHGIVTSSWAGAQGGLGALGKAKDAKAYLEKAIALDPGALQGSAYTSLGTLYDRVPGWPIGFGDKARAEEYFKKSLAINPDGIDPNFFYGEYLCDRDRFQEARPYLEKALKAPPRPGRELADSGRQQ